MALRPVPPARLSLETKIPIFLEIWDTKICITLAAHLGWGRRRRRAVGRGAATARADVCAFDRSNIDRSTSY